MCVSTCEWCWVYFCSIVARPHCHRLFDYHLYWKHLEEWWCSTYGYQYDVAFTKCMFYVIPFKWIIPTICRWNSIANPFILLFLSSSFACHAPLMCRTFCFCFYCWRHLRCLGGCLWNDGEVHHECFGTAIIARNSIIFTISHTHDRQ